VRRKRRPAIRRRRFQKKGRGPSKPPPKLKPPKERDLDKEFEKFKKKFGEAGEIRHEKSWDLAGPNWPGHGRMKKPTPIANISKVMKSPMKVKVFVHTDMLPEKMMWSIWDQKDNKVCHGGPYVHWYSWHKRICKLEKGKMYTLKCNDVFGEGWAGGFLLINGFYYCYDYIFDGGKEQIEFLKI